MDWAGWALFGLLATAILTVVMIAAQLAGWTRLDLPLLLGTIVTDDPDRARVVGFFMHLAIGEGFALGYAAGFALLDTATWWLGALFGLLHAAVALDDPRAAAPRRSPAHGVESGGPGVDRGARAARPPRAQLRRRDAGGRDRVAPCLRGRARSAPHGALRCPTRRRPHRRLRAHRRYAHRRARLVRRSDRLDVRAAFRRRPAVRPSRRRCRRRAASASGPTMPGAPARPSLPARHRDARDDAGNATASRLTLTEGMVAELAGRLLPDDAARPPSRRRTAARSTGDDRVRSALRRRTRRRTASSNGRADSCAPGAHSRSRSTRLPTVDDRARSAGDGHGRARAGR